MEDGAVKKEGGKAVYAPGIWPLTLLGVIVVLGIISGYSGRKKAELEYERLALVWPNIEQMSLGDKMVVRRAAASCGLTVNVHATTRDGVEACLTRGASIEDRDMVAALLKQANAPAAGGAAE